MKINVTKDKVSIETKIENHYGEYNVNECLFVFDEHFNNVAVKRAVFSSQKDNNSFEVDIINNKCFIPHQVLNNVYDEITLGVYGYDISGDELLIRYSPEPTYFVVHDGSYRENAEQPEIITPSQYDMYSQALQEGLVEVDIRLDDVEKQGDYAKEQGDYAKEQGDYAKTIGDQLIEDKENGLFKGEPGEPGANGKDGTNGKDGVTPTFEVGTVTTGEANVEMTSEDNHYKLNFTFPKGGDDAPEPLNFIGKTSLSNPLILNDLEPGFYLTDDPSGYFYIKLTGNESSSAMVGAIDLLLKIHKKPSEAEENETIASAIFTDFRLIEVKKVSTGTGGVSVVYNSNGRPSFVSSDKNQTISGTKTFSKLPESSQTPTTANQLVNKSYVDNAISSIVNGDEVSY